MAEKKEEMYRVELIVSALLRIGVVLSAIIIVFGLVMLFITGESGYPGETYPTSLTAIFSGLGTLKPYAIMMFGLFLLNFNARPSCRCIVIYFFERKRLFVRWDNWDCINYFSY